MSQPHQKPDTGEVSKGNDQPPPIILNKGPRYAEFTGQPMSDAELLAFLYKGYPIRQERNRRGLLMLWLQLPLERRLAVDPAHLERCKRLGWVKPSQTTTGTIWELNRQPPPSTSPKITPTGNKRRLPRTKITEVFDDEEGDENGTGQPDPAGPTAANPNPCVRLYGVGPEGQTCQGCVYLLAVRAGRVYYKCRKRSITSSASTDHRQGWDACKKYQKLETSADPSNANQPAGDQGHSATPAPTNINTNPGA